MPIEGKGKSRGGRVVYYYAGQRQRIYLIAFFPKNVKADLTKSERNELRRLASILKAEP